MAPTTRSKASGKTAANNKKRAATYVEDDGSGNEEDEAVPKRRPRKRAKKDDDARPATKKLVAAAGGRTKKRGRLNALPDMPLDILEEIFSLLDPSDLIRIARTTKAFRRLLLAGNQFSHLWRASWSRTEGYPPCPEDYPLLKWLQLLFGGPYCQVCAAPSVQRIFFSIRARMCKNCLHKSLVNVLSNRVEGIGYYGISEYIPVVGQKRDKYAYEDDIINLQASIASALEGVDPSTRPQALATVLESLKIAFAPWNTHRRECEIWQERKMADRQDDLGEKRSSRREDISRRLEDLGYTTRDMYMIWRLKDVNVSKPLTGRAWDKLLPTLLPLINNARDRRFERERHHRRETRLNTIQSAYIDLLKSGVVKPQDIPYLPRPTACTQFGTLPDLLDEDEPEITDDWRQRVDVSLQDALSLMQDAFKQHQREFASLLEDSGDSTSNSIDVLSRASSVLVVREKFSVRTACFGLQALATSFITLSYGAGSELYRESRLSRVVTPTPESAVKAINNVLHLLDLDRTATIPELDILDPCFICLTCQALSDRSYAYHDGSMMSLRYRPAMNWRNAVQHVFDSHDSCADDVQLHLLTKDERAAVGAEGSAVAIKRHSLQSLPSRLVMHSFACCHCADDLVSRYASGLCRYMPLDAVRAHVRERHDIEAAHEGVDFFMNPVGDRGVLGGMVAEYCHVEEKEAELEVGSGDSTTEAAEAIDATEATAEVTEV
ncbi:unnamed protein product [Peniophora sp. CBMAI 1063]|nr:unnamed protein product [Peniophora sp. CBMAI 1063]